MALSSPTSVKTLRLHFPADYRYAQSAGCAYTTISILTGEDPWELNKFYKGAPLMTPRVMIKHLKTLGFSVLPLTRRMIDAQQALGRYFGDKHVILAMIKMTKNDASWCIIHGGIMWHNLEPLVTTYATSFTFPVLKAYRIYTYEWYGTQQLEAVRTQQHTGDKLVMDLYLDKAAAPESESATSHPPTPAANLVNSQNSCDMFDVTTHTKW